MVAMRGKMDVEAHPDLRSTRCDGATARRVRWGEGMLPGAFIRVWLHRKPVNLQFWSRKAFGVEV